MKITGNFKTHAPKPHNHTSGRIQGLHSATAANSLDMFGQTASNLHAACGVEEGTAIRNAQKKKTKNPQLAAATAS
jgi:hypothetical protein